MTTAPKDQAITPEAREAVEGLIKPKGLYAKLAEVMGELAAIPADKLRKVTVETRTGGAYSYNYITEATLMEELRPRLAARGIAVFYSDEITRTPEADKDDNLTIVRVHLTFVDGETEEKWNSHADGYGTDTGDKGANKAKTSALRYLLWKSFLFASPDDPETENVARRSGGAGGGRSSSGGGGGEATPNQVKALYAISKKLDDMGMELGPFRPSDAIRVRAGAFEGMTKSDASKVIDTLKDAEGRFGESGLEELLEKALNAILGEPKDADQESFPPPGDEAGGYGN